MQKAIKKHLNSVAETALDAGSTLDQLKAEAIVAIKKLDKAAARGVIHRNTVARRKSQIARMINARLKGSAPPKPTPQKERIDPVQPKVQGHDINSDRRRMIAYVALPTAKGERRLVAAHAPTLDNIKELDASEETARAAAHRMEGLGFQVLSISTSAVRVSGPAELFEKQFAVEFQPIRKAHQAFSTLIPTERSMGRLMNLEWAEADGIVFPEPVFRFAPLHEPPVPSPAYHHLRVPDDIVNLLQIRSVHQSGNRGEKVRAAMIDSGFAWKSHPFFQHHGYQLRTVNVPGDLGDPQTDADGHGTGESANFLAVAPKAELIGLRDYDAVAAFDEAMKQGVQLITNSWGTALTSDGPHGFWTPYNLLLEQKIVEVASNGILVFFAAGNGQISFTASLPFTISVGGVYADSNGRLQASSYASSFDSHRYATYPERLHTHVPEVCGLCGMPPRARYILLPVPQGCRIDHVYANQCPVSKDQGDGTKPDDGWAIFSGTSASCPMVAGVAALILSKCPGLGLTEVRQRLYNSTDEVIHGESRMGDKAGASYNKATGFGLVNAEKADR